MDGLIRCEHGPVLEADCSDCQPGTKVDEYGFRRGTQPHRPGWFLVHTHEEGFLCYLDGFYRCHYTAGPTLPLRLAFRWARRKLGL